MKTKIISSFLILAISIGNLFASVQVGDLYYDLEASTLTAQVTFKSYKSSTWSYNENWSITSASIPSSITYQGKTYQVTSIGDHAFERCGNLTSVTIPNTVKTIGQSAFEYCRGLSSVTVPNSVTSIGGEAFKYCSGLTSITIGKGVTSIGQAAFYDCQNLDEVHINDIAAWCKISFESTPLSYAEHLYLNNSEITALVIPEGVTTIGNYAFTNCRITSVTIANSVTKIGDYAFRNCSELATVSFGSSIYSFGKYAFQGCTKLSSVIWNVKNYTSSLTSSTRTPFYYYESQFSSNNYDLRSQITSIAFGEDIECIPPYLCYGMKNLSAINIPNSVTYIMVSAFQDCSGITSVEIPNSVTTIGESAFEGCRNLTSISVGKNVTHIGDRALRGCNKLTSVVWNAINGADCKFPGMEVSPGIYSYIIKTPFYSGNGYASETFNITEQITSFVFGNEVEHIPAYLCYGMSNLSSLIVPNSVTSIGEGAFKGCYGLASIEIPNGITSIERGTFYYCRSMISFEIPNSVTSIGDEAFSYCTGLTNIEIPNSVTSIGKEAFYGCSGLSNIEVPNSVTSIEEGTFYGCVGLTKVTLGNNVTSIGHQAFGYCTGLTSVTCLSITPATIVWTSFWDTNLKAIYVPCGSLNTYKNAPEWIDYSSKIQYTPTNISVFSSDETKGTVSYPETLCDAPQILAIPNDGYHFTKWNDGNTNNPRTIDPSEEKTYTASFEINKYQVQFFGYNGTLLSKQSVTHGTSAIAPEAPQVEHYDFVGWDKEYTNVTSNLDVYAIYEKNTEDVDNINFNTQPRKIVVDGQIFILRGDKIYNAQGALVK